MVMSFARVLSWISARTRESLFVLVETFAAAPPEFALVDVVLLDVTGVGLVLLIARRRDIVGGVEPDDVQRLQRALWCAGGDAPGLINRLGVRNSVHNESRGGLEERNQERIQDVARLLLMDLDRYHAYPTCQLVLSV